MELRSIYDDEVTAWRNAFQTTFGGDPTQDPTGDARVRALIDPKRALAVFDRGQVVATAGTFELTMTVPGDRTVTMAGLTAVAVKPSHRRRGLLRELITAHIQDARAHGATISGLWASEASIYGRFRYGIAAESEDVTFNTGGLTVAAGLEVDDLALIDGDALPRILPPIYDHARARRPGMLARSHDWWAHRWFTDRPDWRRGASPRRHAVVHRGDEPTGYMIYRHRPKWTDGLAAGVLDIEEIIATDARAETTLWRFAATVDLFPSVSYWNAPTDSLLPWLASDPRRIRRRRTDTLWLRIEDVAGALPARRYAIDGALRLAVGDVGAAEAGPTFELVVDGGVARCAATDDAPELRLDHTALGSVFLGGVSPTVLARAGRVTGSDAAIARAAQMFASPTAPWCAEIF